MIYNSFGDSLKRLERKLKIIGSTIENVRAFFDCGNTYQMYEHALKLEEQMEKVSKGQAPMPQMKAAKPKKGKGKNKGGFRF